MQTNEEVKREMEQLLYERPTWTDRLEILSNLFISMGFDLMDIDKKVSRENVVNTILTQKRQEGETLGVALAQQGLTIRIWLEQIQGEEN